MKKDKITDGHWTGLMIPKDLHKELEVEANSLDVSVSWLIRRVLKDYIKGSKDDRQSK